MNDKSRVSIFDHLDLISFLEAYVLLKKSSKPNFSFGSWAKRIGLGTTASLTRVLKGDRIPGAEITKKLVDYFQFEEREEDYFDNLILLEKHKENTRLTPLIHERLRAIKNQKEVFPLELEKLKFMSHWYYVAIREMVLLTDFNEDAHWIQQRLNFKVSLSKIRMALVTLERIGLLMRNERNELVQTIADLNTCSDIASPAIKRNHSENLSNAQKALEEVDIKQREYNSYCFTIKRSEIPEMKMKIREFMSSFSSEYIEEQDGDQTVQLQVQLFPFTK